MGLKEKILDEAKMLYLKYGIKSVTMDDLARHLGVSKKTIYQVVDNKNDLVWKILEEQTDFERRNIDSIKSESSDALQEILLIARFVVGILKNIPEKVIYDLNKYYRRSYAVWEKFHMEYIHQVIKQNLERGQKDGLYRKDIDPEILAKIYVLITHGLSNEDIFPIDEYSTDLLFSQFINYHIRGIVSEQGYDLLNHYLKNENHAN